VWECVVQRREAVCEKEEGGAAGGWGEIQKNRKERGLGQMECRRRMLHLRCSTEHGAATSVNATVWACRSSLEKRVGGWGLGDGDAYGLMSTLMG